MEGGVQDSHCRVHSERHSRDSDSNGWEIPREEMQDCRREESENNRTDKGRPMTDTQRRGKSGKELLKSARWIFLWLLGYPARGHKSFRSRRTGGGGVFFLLTPF